MGSLKLPLTTSEPPQNFPLSAMMLETRDQAVIQQRLQMPSNIKSSPERDADLFVGMIS
jgi:hypothetical protein